MNLLFPRPTPSDPLLTEGDPGIRQHLLSRPGQPVVIVKFSGWGTLLSLFPFFRQLGHAYPDNPVVLVTGSENRPMMTHFSPVDNVVYPRGHQKLTIIDSLRMALKIRLLRPALLINLQMYTRKKLSFLVSKFSGSPFQIGFVDHKTGMGVSGLTHPFFHNRQLPPSQAIEQVAHFLGIRTGDPFPVLDPPREEPRNRLGSLLGNFLSPGGKTIVMNPNASGQSHERRWPTASYAETAKKLLDRHSNARIVLIGLERDQPLVQSILGKLSSRHSGRLLNLAGKLSFPELHALLATCDGYLGNDSGPLHLALLSGTPSVGLFGPTRPDLVLPSRDFPRSLILYEPHYCSPCLHHAAQLPCGGDNICMQILSPSAVVNAIEHVVWNLGEKNRLRHIWTKSEKEVRALHDESPVALYRKRGKVG
uniref:Glycosyltransferase family 9 protein n=1 Tax=Leptospirillum ferriphilum TaxID=178606 RepID=A0A7C3QQL7_9BACT